MHKADIIKQLQMTKGFYNNKIFLTNHKCGLGLLTVYSSLNVNDLPNNTIENSEIIFIYRNIYIKNISGFLHWYINDNINFYKYNDNNFKYILEDCKLIHTHYINNGLIMVNELKKNYCKFIDMLICNKVDDIHFKEQTFYLNINNFKEDLKIDHFVNLDIENEKLNIYFGKKIENECKFNYPENNKKNTSNDMKQILLELIKNNVELKNKLDILYQVDIDYFNKNGIIINHI
jgi:hypothetical protein